MCLQRRWCNPEAPAAKYSPAAQTEAPGRRELASHAIGACGSSRGPRVAGELAGGAVVQVLSPSLEYVPAAQARHVETPTVAEYVPAAQANQTEAPLLAEYVPVAH
jgi:hypothetical protein